MSTKTYKGSAYYLRMMQDACVKIREYTANTTETEFLAERESYDAICLQFSQLGEQVKQLENSSERVIQHFPDDVPWAALKALRNRIDHDYTSVDAPMIWKFAVEEVEGVEQSLKRILKKRFGI